MLNKRNFTHQFTVSKTIADGECYKINGLNIWEHQWEKTGERTIIHDPVRGLTSSCYINEIVVDGKSVRFIAEEVSNGVFIIYHNDY